LNKLKKKKVTMKDIAEKLNISINAVSLALNDKDGVSEKTKAEVIRIANELGYLKVSSSNNKDKSKNICILIESRYFRDVYFYSKVIIGIENEARKNDYVIIVSLLDKYTLEVPTCITNKKVDGILIVGAINDNYLEKILKYNIPVVLVDHASFKLPTDAILTQNFFGSYKATNYLLEKGHKKIGFFGEIDLTLSFKERWLGYSECMRRFYNYDDKIINKLFKYSIIKDVEKYVFKKDYKKISEMILSLEELPTAFICSNDDAALTLFNSLNSLGIRVPDDISIIGFDDIELCSLVNPNLTTMRIEKELMGQKAVKRLLWRMENRNAHIEHIKLDVKLIERGTVKSLNDR
jgi:LacI family transcriptional regulator